MLVGTMKLIILRLVQLVLIIASYITFLQLEGYGLFFAMLSGWVLADFIRTFDIKFFEDE
jgi:hypothetical protein